MTFRPFRLPNRQTGVVRRSLFATTRPAFEKAMAFGPLNDIYAQVSPCHDALEFAEKSLAALGVKVEVDEAQLRAIPQDGPLIIVANHPFGGLEGLVMIAMLGRVRPDVRVLANYFLRRIPELRPAMFFVDPFGRADSAARNLQPLRAAARWLKQGGVLGVFPAGEVSHLTMRFRHVVDPPWNDVVARMAGMAKAAVVPVYFDGRNSDLFQLAGFVHPRLRTALLPRELLKKRDSRVQVQVGTAVPFERLAGFAKPQHMTAYLRMRTYILKGRLQSDCSGAPLSHTGHGREPIIAGQSPQVMLGELDALPADQHLLDSDSIRVSYARADQIPTVLQEIGRVRELAFRAVGEGTGKAIDLDRFDQWYLHLIAWHRRDHQVIGAYRMGQTDVILPQYGKAGLYTSTLFHYKSQLLDQISPAIELGRSFVHPDYQKEYTSLMQLWKGIARFVTLHPRYHILFGPVSISNEYNSVTKQLLIAFLQINRYLPSLGKLIRAKHPPHIRAFDR